MLCPLARHLTLDCSHWGRQQPPSGVWTVEWEAVVKRFWVKVLEKHYISAGKRRTTFIIWLICKKTFFSPCLLSAFSLTFLTPNVSLVDAPARTDTAGTSSREPSRPQGSASPQLTFHTFRSHSRQIHSTTALLHTLFMCWTSLTHLSERVGSMPLWQNPGDLISYNIMI